MPTRQKNRAVKKITTPAEAELACVRLAVEVSKLASEVGELRTRLGEMWTQTGIERQRREKLESELEILKLESDHGAS